MSRADHWLLPDGMDEVLPPRARQIENLRRKLLDLFHSWGYELVLPPKVEFLESLLTGAGHDLELQTFKVTDQLSGRMMGVSADVTPQVARMDAHSMQFDGVARFCYSAEIVRTQPDNLLGSRSPIQIGAELFGDGGADSDLEILSLMTDSLLLAGAENLCLDLGHVGIYRALIVEAGLPDETEAALFDILQHKRLAELQPLLAPWQEQQPVQMLLRLSGLNGGPEVLASAREQLQGAPAAVTDALQELQELVEALQQQYPQVNLYLDLSELRGYHYHTGLVFAAYVPGLGQALAKGGRYDDIGRVFGRARPATGFSTDLKMLASLQGNLQARTPVAAPAAILRDTKGRALVTQLREAGERVVFIPRNSCSSAVDGGKSIQQLADGSWQLMAADKI
ncbi:ATP phosphoribosyltransferase regulatory subunit [Marinospirillum alkaliphilum]|uniref:ATP phosphoribosyltransferase regulatory subunit n=1 Tax=Marinospirillum alkaliphilum DSM 21637 TaxID=1122209 RepID=A0A1K1W1W8_9GAMM|nr:ATP phosphoribosyltransferase regulatory subunit [Marinospirillum alkaliphilum]SFX31362.1 ATP phosphoribosyltransferase regulatory subunit [Marinospirillum alkaliphilum DSM 21637]